MACIYCGITENMAKSHIISKFIRDSITGITNNKGEKRFVFKWIGRRGLPNQDLPKPNLLCKKHDNKFGDVIERLAAKVLMPSKTQFSDSDLIPRGWIAKELPLNVESLRSITVAEYQAINPEGDDAIRKFAVLTAWRALHALNLDNIPAVDAFLKSPEGQQVNQETVRFLDLEAPVFDLFYPYFASIYLTGPFHAASITKSDDDVPFAWAYLEGDGQSGIAVLLGFWIIIWPLLPDGHPNRNFCELQRIAFIDWHDYLIEQFNAF